MPKTVGQMLSGIVYRRLLSSSPVTTIATQPNTVIGNHFFSGSNHCGVRTISETADPINNAFMRKGVNTSAATP